MKQRPVHKKVHTHTIGELAWHKNITAEGFMASYNASGLRMLFSFPLVYYFTFHYRIHEDVAYGTTKLFIRTPKTLVTLEERRNELIPHIIVLLQKVLTFSLKLSYFCYVKYTNTMLIKSGIFLL